jgi:plastocyanin
VTVRSTAWFAAFSVVAVGAAAGCAPDGPDVYTAADEVSETVSTRPPRDSVPTIDESPGSADGVEVATEAEEAAPNGEVIRVRSLDNTFRDVEIEIVAGTEVLWTNNGRNDHDVTPVEAGADWGVEIEQFPPGSEYAHLFSTPGVYDYYCTIHGTPEAGMIGTVVVLPADT